MLIIIVFYILYIFLFKVFFFFYLSYIWFILFNYILSHFLLEKKCQYCDFIYKNISLFSYVFTIPFHFLVLLETSV